MRLISIPGFVAAASMALAPAAFAGSPDHGPHVVPNVHDASTPHRGFAYLFAPRGRSPRKPRGVHLIASAANTALVAKLTPLLPANTTLADAAKGFKNEGQFIAVLHAAKDLGVSFTDLKAEMTGSEHDSLGQAIHDLKPTADAKASAKTAAGEARADITATRPTLADSASRRTRRCSPRSRRFCRRARRWRTPPRGSGAKGSSSPRSTRRRT